MKEGDIMMLQSSPEATKFTNIIIDQCEHSVSQRISISLLKRMLKIILMMIGMVSCIASLCTNPSLFTCVFAIVFLAFVMAVAGTLKPGNEIHTNDEEIITTEQPSILNLN